jgi:hypothetical protein
VKPTPTAAQIFKELNECSKTFCKSLKLAKA